MTPTGPSSDAGLDPILPSAPSTAQGDEVLNLDTEIAQLKSRRLHLRGKRRILPLLAVAVLIALSIVAVAFGDVAAPTGIGYSDLKAWLAEVVRKPFSIIVIGAATLGCITFLIASELADNSLIAEIDLLQTKKRIATRLQPGGQSGPLGQVTPPIDEGKPASYFDSLVTINVENLAEYYSLVKVHTNNSFRASLFVGIIGFSLIVVGVIASFGGVDKATPATIAAVSGVIVEFISGVFFYLYNRTVRELKEYHDSLLSVQNVLLSFKLVNDTEDATAKKDMTMQMCQFLLAGVELSKTSHARSSKEASNPVPPSSAS
jgi:hypothetical protein